MASLGEVLGAILSQIGIGRSQADISMLEVASIYKDHPLLSSFPVPKMKLEEVVIEMKVAFSATPGQNKILTSRAKAEILDRIDKVVEEVAYAESPAGKLDQRIPRLPEVWKSMYGSFRQRLSDLLPEGMEVVPATVARGMASVIIEQLTRAVLNLEVKDVTTRVYIEKEAQQLESSLASKIEEAIVTVLDKNPVEKNRLDVLMTASELQSIRPDQITTVKLTLREADQVWTQVESEAGEVKSKLIPQ